MSLKGYLYTLSTIKYLNTYKQKAMVEDVGGGIALHVPMICFHE